MEYSGTYKAIKAAIHVEGQGLVFDDISNMIAQAASPSQKRDLEQKLRTLIIVDSSASINQAMEIPAGTPAEQIEAAKARGMAVTDDGKYIITKPGKGKIENGELYMQDPSKFLTGSEWVKVSTGQEGELNLITTIYKKI